MTLDFLCTGEPAGWLEGSARQVWLQFLQERQATPDQVPAALDLLINACRQARQFPLWAFTFRALAYYDLRQEIRELLGEASKKPEIHSAGLALVLAEARLECAQAVFLAASLLRDIDIHDCLPLTPEVTHLWQQWLLAEFAWWEEQEPRTLERVQADIATLLRTPAPDNDPYLLSELQRLAHHAALLGARYALSQCDTEKAWQWIALTRQTGGSSWESQYLSGLADWCAGDHCGAQAHFEQSLAGNPFQSRVRFELELLCCDRALPSPQAVPGMHDALASAAVAHFRLGQTAEARHFLERLDQVEASYSLRLIWPRARILRLRQGYELRTHLAEADQNWPEALKHWDAAWLAGLPPDETARRDIPGPVKGAVYRAHRLYLLGRCLQQQKAMGEDHPDQTTHIQFHKELGKMSIRPLTGEAMFYRSLAAEDTMPVRAVADWQALLRQTAWVERAQKLVPGRLLYLGDRLLKAGLYRDAQRAYAIADTTSIAGARERLLASVLITHQPLEATGLLQELKAAGLTVTTDNPFWLLLHGCCLLAQQPPDVKAARLLLKQACQAGLPAQLAQVAERLLPLASRDPGASDKLRSFLCEVTTADLPPSLRLGLEAIGRLEGLKILERFKETFGTDWMAWCPLPPTEILGWQLRKACARSDYAAALSQAHGAEELGVGIPGRWKAFLFAAQAVQMALNGDFTAAELSQQQALASLSPGRQEMNE